MMNALGLFVLLAAAAECPPIAVVEGSGTAVQELIAALNARGVRVEPPGLPPGECGVLHVKLTPAADGLAIAISDPWGRTAERTVKSALTAATLVESWARMDLLEGTQVVVKPSTDAPPIAETPQTPAIANPHDQPALLQPLKVSSSTAAVQPKPAEPAPDPKITDPKATDPKATDPKATESTETTAAPVETRDPLMWRIGAEMSVDDQAWVGAVGSVCGRVGFLCIGATARFDIDTERSTRAADALIDVAVPLSLGPLTLTPAVGAGGGWMDNGGIVYTGRNRFREPTGDDGFGRSSDLSPRLEIRADASLRIAGNFALQLGASATYTVSMQRDFELDDRLIRTYAGLAWGAP